MAIQVVVWAAFTVGAQAPAILLAVLIGILLAAAGYHSLSTEIAFLAPLLTLSLVGAVTLPIILWLGFTKTLVRVDERYFEIEYRGLFTRRQIRWPKQLVGDVRQSRHAVQVLSVDGRQSAKLQAFWPWEEAMIIATLREAFDLPEL